MSDWDNSDKEEEVIAPPAKIVKSKWEGEDDEEQVASDWDDSDDEQQKPTTTSAAAPPKKKRTLKQVLAEKEAAKAERIARGVYSEDELVEMHPQERVLLDKEKEMQADLKNAADLFGGMAIGSTSIQDLLKMNPNTKEDFQQLSLMIMDHIIKPFQSKPLYHQFVEMHVRELAQPLKDVEVRKAASALTTLANEKQKEAKDKASGKKKAKPAAKSTLGASKVVGKIDTRAYEEALDDFGDGEFM